MTENKLEEIIDLLAVYGGFDREYLRDKLLTFANDGRSETKNKMGAVAALFGKKLFDKFHVKLGYDTFCARFSPYGFEIFGEHCMWTTDGQILNKLLIGQAVIINENEAEC